MKVEILNMISISLEISYWMCFISL